MVIEEIVLNLSLDSSGEESLILSTTDVSVVYAATAGPRGETGLTGANGLTYQTFTVPATLTTGVGKARFYAPTNLSITNVFASVGSSPSGSSIIVDVYKNGVTIFTTQANRPTITAGSFQDSASVPDSAQSTMNSGDYLTISIIQVGSIIAGSDLTIQITLQ